MTESGKTKYQALRSPRRQQWVVNTTTIALLGVSLWAAWMFTQHRNAGRYVTLAPTRVLDLSISLPEDWDRVVEPRHANHSGDQSATEESETNESVLTFVETSRPQRTLVIASITTPTMVPPHVVLNQAINARLSPEARTELANLRPVRRQKYGSFVVTRYAGVRINAGLVEQHMFAVITQDAQHWWAFHLLGTPDRRRLLFEQAEDADRLLASICASVTEGNMRVPSVEHLTAFGLNSPALQTALQNWFVFAEKPHELAGSTATDIPAGADTDTDVGTDVGIDADADANTNAPSPRSVLTPMAMIPIESMARFQMIRMLGTSNGSPDSLTRAIGPQRKIEIRNFQVGPIQFETALLSPGTPSTLYVQLVHARLADGHGVLWQLIAEREAMLSLGTHFNYLLNQMAHDLNPGLKPDANPNANPNAMMPDATPDTNHDTSDDANQDVNGVNGVNDANDDTSHDANGVNDNANDDASHDANGPRQS